MASLILVVDDDDAIRNLLVRTLQREGYSVESAHDGLEAIELLERKDYDAVLLDLMMPRLDGPGVVRHLEKTKPAVLERVIIMTAHHPVPDCDLPEEISSRPLRKPFDIQEVVRRTRGLLAHQH